LISSAIQRRFAPLDCAFDVFFLGVASSTEKSRRQRNGTKLGKHDMDCPVLLAGNTDKRSRLCLLIKARHKPGRNDDLATGGAPFHFLPARRWQKADAFPSITTQAWCWHAAHRMSLSSFDLSATPGSQAADAISSIRGRSSDGINDRNHLR